MNDKEHLTCLIDFIKHPCDSMNSCQPCEDCKKDKQAIIDLMNQGRSYQNAVHLHFGDKNKLPQDKKYS